jgi:hypothetical protein
LSIIITLFVLVLTPWEHSTGGIVLPVYNHLIKEGVCHEN